MWQCLATDLEILVHRGHLYLPLLLDPDIHQEVRNPSPPSGFDKETSADLTSPPLPAVLKVQERFFVQAVSAASLVKNYAQYFPKAHAHRVRSLQEQYSLTADLLGVALDPKLVTIVFHILPHFLRREGLTKRRRLQEGETLDLIRERFGVPYHFEELGRRLLDLAPLQEMLHRLEAAPREPEPLPEGLVSTTTIRLWWEEALTAQLLAAERTRLLQEISDRERWAAAQKERLAVLLYLAAKGHLEVDGFGFSRLRNGKEYRIYKRTGPYALKDFYGRVYHFPDCRVAVSTMGRLRPVVVDHYKHPFLRRHGPGQAICVGPESQNLTFTAPNVIQALEEGINSLVYSYDSRGRRGYHRLDVLPGTMRLVDFEDYRIPADHPLIVSGQLKVKNQAF